MSGDTYTVVQRAEHRFEVWWTPQLAESLLIDTCVSVADAGQVMARHAEDQRQGDQ